MIPVGNVERVIYQHRDTVRCASQPARGRVRVHLAVCGIFKETDVCARKAQRTGRGEA